MRRRDFHEYRPELDTQKNRKLFSISGLQPTGTGLDRSADDQSSTRTGKFIMNFQEISLINGLWVPWAITSVAIAYGLRGIKWDQDFPAVIWPKPRRRTLRAN